MLDDFWNWNLLQWVPLITNVMSIQKVFTLWASWGDFSSLNFFSSDTGQEMEAVVVKDMKALTAIKKLLEFFPTLLKILTWKQLATRSLLDLHTWDCYLIWQKNKKSMQLPFQTYMQLLLKSSLLSQHKIATFSLSWKPRVKCRKLEGGIRALTFTLKSDLHNRAPWSMRLLGLYEDNKRCVVLLPEDRGHHWLGGLAG